MIRKGERYNRNELLMKLIDIQYTRNDFDSISIINNVPIEGSAEDIRIYN